MPGLVNTHMHLFGSFARGLVNDLSFTPWIQKKFYVTSKGLNPDNYYLGTQFAALEMLKTGTTRLPRLRHLPGARGAGRARRRDRRDPRRARARDGRRARTRSPSSSRRSDQVTKENLEASEAFIARFNGAADGRVRRLGVPDPGDLLLGRAVRGRDGAGRALSTSASPPTRTSTARTSPTTTACFDTRPIERFHALGILNRRFLGHAHGVALRPRGRRCSTSAARPRSTARARA